MTFTPVKGNIVRCDKCGHPMKRQASPLHECKPALIEKRYRKASDRQIEWLAER